VELPVSGLKIRFRLPDGSDDLAISEASGETFERALEALRRLVQPEEHSGSASLHGSRRDPWMALTIADFEASLLGLRRFLFGDKVACVFRDKSHECEERMELEFSIAALLEEAHPSPVRGVVPASGDAGWFQLTATSDSPIRFRLPSLRDQIEVAGKPQAAKLLARRCIDGDKLDARTVARVERAMESMAPSVSRPLAGNCPNCGKPVSVPLHVPHLVVEELQASSTGVHEEIDAIAAAYHWEESAILALPQKRRRAYAETVRRRERGAV